MGLGSNGGLIDNKAARALKEAGVKTVSISLDSNIPQQHDEFRGVTGSWNKAVGAIKALAENGVLVQVNTTLTQQNYNQIDEIMSLVEDIGVENFHLFFLVPTGRGAKIADISPEMYEHMIKTTFAKTFNHRLNVRPSCAPQFMRIAKDMDYGHEAMDTRLHCGDVLLPYLPERRHHPLSLPSYQARQCSRNNFKDIWFNSSIFKALRDPSCLKGKCGECSYKIVCGGCRARAYGLSGEFIDYCGDLHEPTELKADYLAEDPWCVYQPKPRNKIPY